MDTSIRLALTDNEILRCYPVLKELRPQLLKEEFVSLIRDMYQSGYCLAFYDAETGPVSVAGFRQGRSLSWGKFLYVDDLVTLASERSKGYGKSLLNWLHWYARKLGCQQIHLDSGIQREDAHRFYQREGMTRAAYHFASQLSE